MRLPRLSLPRLPLLFFLALASTALAHASALPVGVYTLSATTPTSGIHTSDPGTLAGTLVFDANSSITSADLLYTDLGSGSLYTFTSVGPTAVFPADHSVSATVSNVFNSGIYYAFGIRVPGLANGNFLLTCGTDCDTFVVVDDGTPGGRYEEFTGSISPAAATVTPEPASLLLLGTGALGILGILGTVRRRRFES